MIHLLFFSCWIQSRYQKSSNLSIKIGKTIGAPVLIKNYYYNTKVHVFDVVNKNELPIVQIAFNQNQTQVFSLSNYLGHETEPYVQVAEDFSILFTFQLLNNTQKVYEKYCHEKSEVEKHYLCEGIKDFIRSEQEFLAQFQRNEQIQQLRQLQAEESRIEADLCEQIIETKKYSLSVGKVLVVIVIFLFFGFLIGRHDDKNTTDIFNDMFYGRKDRNKEKQSEGKNQKRNKKLKGETAKGARK